MFGRKFILGFCFHDYCGWTVFSLIYHLFLMSRYFLKLMVHLTLSAFLGIGGFQVRARGKKDDEKAREEANLDPQVLELRRKRSNWRTKKKIKLLEKFPSYIQVSEASFYNVDVPCSLFMWEVKRNFIN